jgi:hypothetical protein
MNVPVRVRRLHAASKRRRAAAAKKLAAAAVQRVRVAAEPVPLEPAPAVDGPGPVVPPKPPRPAAVQRWIDGPEKPETPGYSVDPNYESPGRRYGNPQYVWRSKASRDANPLAPGGNSIFGSDWR